MSRIAFLGPPGTFTEEALLTQADLAQLERAPMATVPEVITAVDEGQTIRGIVPIENSIEGSVAVTLDTLAFDTDLLIQREIDLPISLQLATKPGTKLGDIHVVMSHPHALAQCRVWKSNKLPGAATEAANSTSEAARLVSQTSSADRAAICTAYAAKLYGLKVLASDIQDHSGNQTRFVLLGRGIPAPTGHDKTSIVCFQRQDKPGSLLAILSEFASRNINLTKLESRPTKHGLGQYCFFIDFNGHLADERIADCLRHLAARQAEVKFLGSYPVAGAEAPSQREQATKQWKQAGAWLDELRAQVRQPHEDPQV
ncbi:MAG: prephenate dehydratase [Acidimicrobiia bacterium]